MFGEKKLDIYEDQNRLEITLKWFSPKAYFLLFFSMAWCGFLVFWYTMAIGGGAPLVFTLFPLIHVAVGVYLVYYTACLFFNQTFVDINDNYLTVTHKPIPWWRGNKDIGIGEIEQLYVKENKSSSKNGTSYSYELRAKMRDKSDKSILAVDGLESQQLLQIEDYLERFIGITDRPVKGEFGKANTPVAIGPQPRHQRRDFSDSPLSPVYHSKPGDALELKDSVFQTGGVTQYDWKDGNSDKQLQLLDELEEETLVYISQNQALLKAYREKSLSLAESQALLFDPKQPLSSIVFNGDTYTLKQHQLGDAFMANVSGSVDMEQWWYESTNGQYAMRILNQSGMLRFFQGHHLHSSDFDSRLDLNPIPQREKELRNRDDKSWDESDLV